MNGSALKPELVMSSTACCKKQNEEVCFHCHQPLPSFANIHALIEGEFIGVCCHGCKSAAEFISEQGMADFYQERDDQRVQTHTVQNTLDNYSIEDWNISQTDKNYEVTLSVPGLYCSSCAWLVKKSLADLSNEHNLKKCEAVVQIDSKQLSLTWQKQSNTDIKHIDLIVARLAKLGYPPRPLEQNQSIQFEATKHENDLFQKRILVAGLGTMQVMTYAVADYLGAEASPNIARFLELVSMLVATIVVIYSGQHFFSNAWRDIKNKHLGMDVPIALAIGSAFFFSVVQTLTYWENRVLYYDSAVMFVFFLLLGRYVEMRTRHRFIDTSDAVSNSLPSLIHVLRKTQASTEHLQISPKSIQVGDIIELKSGDIVPCDGIIINGSAECDESLVTGESKAVLRNQHQQLLTSMRVVSGQITLRCKHDWKNSSLASLQKLIINGKQLSHAQDGNIALLSRYFVLAVLIIIIPVTAFWLATQADRTFEIVLAMLIASCPCAFALAAPIGTTVASNLLRKHGVLLANGEALNLLAKANLWCFDKTGTLTQGKPDIISVDIVADLGKSNSTEQQSHYLNILAALEQNSQHPLANAFASIQTNLTVSNQQEFAGMGVSGIIDGTQYYAGKLSWITELINTPIPDSITLSDSTFSQIVLATKNEILALVQCQDVARDGIKELSHSLRKKQINTVLISGDTQASVGKFANKNKFNQYYAEQTPQQKLELLNQLSKKNQPVVVVGDGANDAPILAHADVAIAFASGSELSQAQADFLVLNRSLTALSFLQKVADKSHQIMKQNLLWAIAYNALVLPLAAYGFLTPWIAAIGMSSSSLGVVLNSARIKRV